MASIDSLIKVPNPDGSGEEMTLFPISKAQNIKTTEEIEIMLSAPLGSMKPGEKIAAGTDLNSIIKKLVQQQIPPTYSAPSLKIVVSGETAGSYEVGTKLSPTLTSTFTKNDAGAVTSHVIKKNGTAITSGGTGLTETFTDSIVIGTSDIKYTSTVAYEAGAVKNDNFGEPYASTSIKAGSKDSAQTITFSGYRKYFYGAMVGDAPADSDGVRGMTGSTKGAANNTTFSVAAKAGDTTVVFAYPATLRDVTSVKYVEAGNDESKGLFNYTLVNVKGAGDDAGVNYKVYVMKTSALPAAATFAVTI